MLYIVYFSINKYCDYLMFLIFIFNSKKCKNYPNRLFYKKIIFFTLCILYFLLIYLLLKIIFYLLHQKFFNSEMLKGVKMTLADFF